MYDSKAITTPLPWKALATSLVLLTGLVVGNYNLSSGQRVSFPFLLCLAVLIYCTVVSCVRYTISEVGLTIRLLWIPIRTFEWREVSYAVYSYAWKEASRVRYRYTPSVMRGHMIFVSLKYCPPYDPVADSRADFAFAHPLSFIAIQLPANCKDDFIAIFRGYFPELKIQSDTFQVK